MTRIAQFVVFLEGPDSLEDDDILDALFEAGCDDATFGTDHGLKYAKFDREISSDDRGDIDAIREAIDQIEGATDLRATRVELNGESSLMSLAQIAERIGQSRESIRLYSTSQRGPGGFPSPALMLGHPLWRWSDVGEWFVGAGVLEPDDPFDPERGRLLDQLNAELEYRRAESKATSTG